VEDGVGPVKAVAVLGVVVALAASVLLVDQGVSDMSQRKATVLTGARRLPLAFEPNVGQADASVAFVAGAPSASVGLSASGVELAVGDAAVGIELVGARADLHLAGDGLLPGRVNYFGGRDPSRWQAGVPTYEQVVAPDVWPGISVRYHGGSGIIEYDFDIDRGSDPGKIRLAVSGGEARVDRYGSLVIRTPAGTVAQPAPHAYQDLDGHRARIDAAFVAVGDGHVGLRLGAYRRDRPLVIDPTIVYSSLLGGNASDLGIGVAVDTNDAVYVTGSTLSSNFPTHNSYKPNHSGGTDVFVTKIDPTGSSIVYSTYLGVNGEDRGTGIAVDAAGDAYIAGTTTGEFPVVNAAQPLSGAGVDAFVAKLDPSGSSLLYSTYLGGSGNDGAFGIAVDAAGDAYVAGYTMSTNFPISHPVQPASGGGTADAFVAKYGPTGTVQYSTYLGGSGFDEANAVAIDGSGDPYVAGLTYSTDFPTVSAAQSTHGGGSADAFVTKLNSAGSAIMYSTYLGGNGFDQALGVVVDGMGAGYISGYTQSSNFPAVGAYQGAHTSDSGKADAFVTKLDPSGLHVVYSTYLGGSGDDRANSIAVDSLGAAYVSGTTSSNDFPVSGAAQPTLAGGTDAFVTKLTPVGSAVDYSTYLGGSGNETESHLAVNYQGSAIVAGSTLSSNFPTTAGAFQTAAGGSSDVFITRLESTTNPLPTTTAARTTTSAPATTSTTVTNTSTSGPTATTTSTPQEASTTAVFRTTTSAPTTGSTASPSTSDPGAASPAVGASSTTGIATGSSEPMTSSGAREVASAKADTAISSAGGLARTGLEAVRLMIVSGLLIVAGWGLYRRHRKANP
jgi:hypothetical protein